MATLHGGGRKIAFCTRVCFQFNIQGAAKCIDELGWGGTGMGAQGGAWDQIPMSVGSGGAWNPEVWGGARARQLTDLKAKALQFD